MNFKWGFNWRFGLGVGISIYFYNLICSFIFGIIISFSILFLRAFSFFTIPFYSFTCLNLMDHSDIISNLSIIYHYYLVVFSFVSLSLVTTLFICMFSLNCLEVSLLWYPITLSRFITFICLPLILES